MSELEKVEIRRAQLLDARGILHCLAEAFAPYRDQYSAKGFADTVLNETSVRDRMHQMRLLVAVRNGEIAGTVGGAVGENGEGHLRGMAVLPIFQGMGIADQLLAASKPS